MDWIGECPFSYFTVYSICIMHKRMLRFFEFDFILLFESNRTIWGLIMRRFDSRFDILDCCSRLLFECSTASYSRLQYSTRTVHLLKYGYFVLVYCTCWIGLLSSSFICYLNCFVLFCFVLLCSRIVLYNTFSTSTGMLNTTVRAGWAIYISSNLAFNLMSCEIGLSVLAR